MSAMSEAETVLLTELVFAYTDLLRAQVRLVRSLNTVGLLTDGVAVAAVADADQLGAALRSVRVRHLSAPATLT